MSSYPGGAIRTGAKALFEESAMMESSVCGRHTNKAHNKRKALDPVRLLFLFGKCVKLKGTTTNKNPFLGVLCLVVNHICS